jgi:hypothetical protein
MPERTDERAWVTCLSPTRYACDVCLRRVCERHSRVTGKQRVCLDCLTGNRPTLTRRHPVVIDEPMSHAGWLASQKGAGR